MFVTQRGWLYAIPAALVLLWHWRERFFRQNVVAAGDPSAAGSANADDSGQSVAVDVRGYRTGPLPFWVEFSLCASMPLFNVHALSVVTVVPVFLLAFTVFL